MRRVGTKTPIRRAPVQAAAVLYACGANAAHGLRRTNADKRRAVLTLLEDGEWAKLSDEEIARRCAVSRPFVGGLRPEVSRNDYEITKRTVTRNGVTYPMNAKNIGRSNESAVCLFRMGRIGNCHPRAHTRVAPENVTRCYYFSAGHPSRAHASCAVDAKRPQGVCMHPGGGRAAPLE